MISRSNVWCQISHLVKNLKQRYSTFQRIWGEYRYHLYGKQSNMKYRIGRVWWLSDSRHGDEVIRHTRRRTAFKSENCRVDEWLVRTRRGLPCSSLGTACPAWSDCSSLDTFLKKWMFPSLGNSCIHIFALHQVFHTLCLNLNDSIRKQLLLHLFIEK